MPTACGAWQRWPSASRDVAGEEGRPAPGDELRGLGSDALHRIAERAAHEAKALDSAAVRDLRVDTDGRSVHEIAADVRARGGNWPNLFP